mmetsp:Transcript_23349/g.77551  ORF Transcript_23349/g.77551 Transcript_23349/m.77551 type:complete len:87 (+) Transcript_23349:111-371(+)
MCVLWRLATPPAPTGPILDNGGLQGRHHFKRLAGRVNFDVESTRCRWRQRIYIHADPQSGQVSSPPLHSTHMYAGCQCDVSYTTHW